jgi:alkylation response protein AidB-like acyl-CoA dehydrogenase
MSPHDDAFLAAAVQAMHGPGDHALDALGWWELLPQLDEDDACAAVLAVFRAQGRALANSAALGGLLAQPFIDGSDLAPGDVVAAILRHSPRRGPVWVLVGERKGRRVLFDEPGRGVYVVDPAALELHSVDVPGRAAVHEISIDLEAHTPWRDAADVDQARTSSLYLGRVAAAAEMLGAAEQALDLAVQHACTREQFGRPIGTFQAVRHLLAWAATDCTAIASVIAKACALATTPPARYDEVAKALAGRNARRACQRSLQVLGGIGFTAEHPHHHHYSRVLLLDALLGSSAELTHTLGRWLRTSGTDPGFTTAVLHACT